VCGPGDGDEAREAQAFAERLEEARDVALGVSDGVEQAREAAIRNPEGDRAMCVCPWVLGSPLRGAPE
jgi:hypothetical protein